MEEGWEDLCKVKKLLEEGRKGKAELDIELFLAKNDNIKGLIFY